MSEPTTPQGGEAQKQPTVEELLKNSKAETDRKIGNVESLLKDLTSKLTTLTQPKPAPQPEENLDDLILTNPKRYAEIIKEQTKREVTEDITKRTNYEQKRNQVAQKLYNDYPEMADQASPLFQKAAQIFNSFSEDDKQSPLAMQVAAREAAIEMDVKPKSKREVNPDVDTFSFGSGSSGSGSGSPRKGKDELPSELTDFAKIMGINTDDPAVKARLKEKSGRTWGTYKPVNKK